TISSGIMSIDLNGDQIVAIPLQSDESMEIGYIAPADGPLSPLAARYLEHLRRVGDRGRRQCVLTDL
ncbi:MAG: hypothetical protein ACI4SZ_02550, partial [Lachnospiraceae bacterium]